MMKEKLLERKIKILQSDLKLKDRLIGQLEYQVQNHKLPPVENYLKPGIIFETFQNHREQLRVLDLEIENLELKERIKELVR
jgi:hypothetical protein